MTHFILSPCIVKNASGDFVDTMDTLCNYHNLLHFADEWLDLKLLIHEYSCYNQLNGYMPPLNSHTLSGFFVSNIVPIFKSLVCKGDVIYDDKKNIQFPDAQFNCVDQNEFDLIALCLKVSEDSEALLFVGNPNSHMVGSNNITIDGKEFVLDVLLDPIKDETSILDTLIKMSESSEECMLPCAIICGCFAEEAKMKGDRGAYRHYGDIIARRNGFTKIPYNPDHYKPDKPSYISRNKCYYISLDDLHGTFEAFKVKTKNTDYLGEYGFDGKLITAKSSAAETHKFFK